MLISLRYAPPKSCRVLFDLSHYEVIGEPSAVRFAYAAGYDDRRLAALYLKQTINVARTAAQVRWAVCALHGALDQLIPATQVDKLRKALANNPDVEFDMPDDGDHCCRNLHHVVDPRMGDWFAERLGGHV